MRSIIQESASNPKLRESILQGFSTEPTENGIDILKRIEAELDLLLQRATNETEREAFK